MQATPGSSIFSLADYCVNWQKEQKNIIFSANIALDKAEGIMPKYCVICA